MAVLRGFCQRLGADGRNRPQLKRHTGPLNRYIKELCQLAGITAPVEVTRFVDGLKVGTSVPKYTLVSTHCARRSFATNEYLRAMAENRSYRPIMDILGHSTEKMFFRYIKITAEQTAVDFAKARRAG